MTIKTLLSKLNNKYFLSLLSNGSMALLAMATVALLYRFLTPSDVGAWVFFLTIWVLLDTFRTGFLQTAVIKFYAGAAPERGRAVLGAVWYLSLAITVILIGLNILVGLVCWWLDYHFLDPTIQWFGITFLATLPATLASWIQQAEQRFDRLLWLRLGNQGLFLLLVIVLIGVDALTLQTVFLTNLLVNLVNSLATLALGWTHWESWRIRERATIAEVFNYGKYTVGTTISTNLLRSSDTFIILMVLGPAGPAALAMYSIPMRLMEIIEIPLRSFLATAMPAMSEAFNRGQPTEVAYTMQKYAGMLTLALVPVSLLAIGLADLAVEILGGTQYAGTAAVSVYRIFMSFAMFFPIDRFIGVTLDIIHQPRINFYKVLVMLSTNIVADFIGVYYAGINGAAMATLFTFLSGVGFGYFWLRKYLDFSIAGMFRIGFQEWLALYRQYRHPQKTV